MTKSQTTFGETIRDLRQKKDLGLRELARKIDCSAAYLSRIESGIYDPPAPDKIEALARELGVHPDVLFTAAHRMPQDVEKFMEEETEKAILLFRSAKNVSVEKLNKWLKEQEKSKPKS